MRGRPRVPSRPVAVRPGRIVMASRARRVLVVGAVTGAMGALCAPGVAAAQDPGSGAAPGAPGAVEQALPADKSGFGTATTLGSKVWFTVQREGGLGEI